MTIRRSLDNGSVITTNVVNENIISFRITPKKWRVISVVLEHIYKVSKRIIFAVLIDKRSYILAFILDR